MQAICIEAGPETGQQVAGQGNRVGTDRSGQPRRLDSLVAQAHPSRDDPGNLVLSSGKTVWSNLTVTIMYRKYLSRPFDYRDSRVETGATSGFLSPEQISNHAMARVRCSLSAGVDLALMKAGGMVHGSQVLIATGARVIDDKAGVTQNPAAHALPCGISVSGKGPVHRLPRALAMQEFIAEPYKYTNIIPQPANAADHRAEAFSRRDETGLVGSFRRFCQRVLVTHAAPKGGLNRSVLQLAFDQLMQDYQQAFAIALSKSEPSASGRVRVVPGQGTLVDPSIPYSGDEFREDNIRTAIRGQMAAMKEFEASSFSGILIEQVESDFHDRLKESGG